MSQDTFIKQAPGQAVGGGARSHITGSSQVAVNRSSLLACNYRTRRGEIDLIAFDGRTLIFVEVKTHRLGRSQPPASVSPLAYLSAGQLARYQPVAQAWLDDERYATPEAQSMRFDAIGVLVDAKGAVVDLQHIEGSE